MKNNGSEVASETFYREAEKVFENYPNKPYYLHYGPVFRRSGGYIYFLSGQGFIKSVDLANPSTGFVTCAKEVRAFDVDSQGIVCVDSERKRISHYSSQTNKSSGLLNQTPRAAFFLSLKSEATTNLMLLKS